MQQLRNEPAEAEFAARRRALVGERLGIFVPGEKDLGLEALAGQRGRAGLRGLAAGLEVEQPLVVGPDNEGRFQAFALQKADAGIRGSGEPAKAGAEAESLHRFAKLARRMRAGKALYQQRGIEWNAVELAEATHQPHKVLW